MRKLMAKVALVAVVGLVGFGAAVVTGLPLAGLVAGGLVACSVLPSLEG